MLSWKAWTQVGGGSNRSANTPGYSPESGMRMFQVDDHGPWRETQNITGHCHILAMVSILSSAANCLMGGLGVKRPYYVEEML